MSEYDRLALLGMKVAEVSRGRGRPRKVCGGCGVVVCRCEPCAFVHSKTSGGRNGTVCGIQEYRHCKARNCVSSSADEHDDECWYSESGTVRMVHHTFHRG